MSFALHTVSGTTRRIVSVLALAVALLMITGAIAPQSAEAWYRADRSGRPGPFTAPTPMAIDSWDGFVWYPEWRTQRGPLVYRSPATRGAQNVVGIYLLQEWTPSFGWSNITSQSTPAYRIPRGVNAVRLPALNVTPSAMRGYFRVAYAIGWTNARTGTRLGSSLKMPNLTTDHRCVTNRRPCETGAGFIRTGRLHTHGGGW